MRRNDLLDVPIRGLIFLDILSILSGDFARQTKAYDAYRNVPAGFGEGVSLSRLWGYVTKWCQWLWGGVYGRVSRKGGVRKYWVWIIRALGIKKDAYLSSIPGR